MLVVNAKDAFLTQNPEGGFVTEASDLGLTPGEWPDFIAIVNDAGSGSLFNKGAAIRYGVENEFAGFTYWTKGGTRLEVVND